MRCGIYPFWFWNGIVTESGITEQLRLIAESGCRGAVLHACSGNNIEYMSERWLQLLASACETARRLGLKIWLCDEDVYPSEQTGQQVQYNRPDFCRQVLSFVYAPSSHHSSTFASFDAISLKRVDESVIPIGTEVLRFTLETETSHVDTFNQESCQRFLNFSHAKYAALKPYLGHEIEAIYTDDKSFSTTISHASIPWSNYLTIEYRRRYGDDIVELLPALVENMPDSSEVRTRFYATAAALVLSNFIEPQKKWAESVGIDYVEHLGCGDRPSNTIIRHFGAAMPFLRLESIPSIDDYLCNINDQRYLFHAFNDCKSFQSHSTMIASRAPLLHYKFSSSIAHQFGDGRMSAQCLSFFGWSRTPEYIDRQMAFEIAMGVNIMMPHAFYYTIGDGACKNNPPSSFKQQPFFSAIEFLFNKWTESAELLGNGRFHADMLLIYPQSVISLDSHELDSKFPERLQRETGRSLTDAEKAFAEISLNLHRRHIGFDFGEESFFGEAKIENGKFILGNSAYSIIMMPPIGMTLTESTLELLDTFKAAGGRVVTDSDIGALVPDIWLDGDGADEVLVHTRDVGEHGEREYFFVNVGVTPAHVKASFGRTMEVYDPSVGAMVHIGTSFPEGFSIPVGGAIHALSPEFSGDDELFDADDVLPGDIYGEPIAIRHAEFVSVARTQANIMAATNGNEIEFDLSAGTRVKSLVGKRLPSEILINGVKTVVRRIEHFPCDNCYDAVSIEELLREGHNRIEVPGTRDLLYITGNFKVSSGAKLEKETQTSLGDLAQQGYPFYWGCIVYKFTFTGRCDAIKLDFAGGGLAEVFVNDEPCPTVANPNIPCAVEFSESGCNELRICLHNTAENFVCANAAPFGLAGIKVYATH